MNSFQKLAHLLFKRQYVLLIYYDGASSVHNVYLLGGRLYANPYQPYTRTEILPGGRVSGPSYIYSWKPVTDKTVKLFNSTT